MAIAISLPPDEVADARWRARHFSIEYFGESPLTLHSRRDVGFDGAPRMTNEFQSYLEGSLYEQRLNRREQKLVDLDDDPRRRVTKAFRKLRSKAPHEFDVLYRMCVIDQVGRNLRADDTEALERQFTDSMHRSLHRLRSRPEGKHLTEGDVVVLVVSGIRKLMLWAG